MHKAKKSLGQNFLKSEIALKKIVEAGEIIKSDVILEIGPGKGALTEKLLQVGSKVIAVVKDHELFEFLKTKFEKEIKEKKLILINDDILSCNIEKIIKNVVLKSIAQADELSIANFQQKIMCGFQNNIFNNFYYKIIANIPYNITGAILKKFLTTENQPERMILMVQHEVAKRIVARDEKKSILSISVKAYGEPKIIAKVDKRYFSPSPKVDSAIIAIKNISRKIFKENSINEKRFWEIVKAGFAHKRKKLSSNLKNERISAIKTLGNKRAEELTLEDWIMLAKS
ncbi:MAG: 16S rRNA (adenine(1518)-N(6)/adenine(1519)-N(6))-dimethyltransferase RsmA [Candidatus Paceibacterota bacterium]